MFHVSGFRGKIPTLWLATVESLEEKNEQEEVVVPTINLVAGQVLVPTPNYFLPPQHRLRFCFTVAIMLLIPSISSVQINLKSGSIHLLTAVVSWESTEGQYYLKIIFEHDPKSTFR
jgi:hypothetical protein